MCVLVGVCRCVWVCVYIWACVHVCINVSPCELKSAGGVSLLSGRLTDTLHGPAEASDDGGEITGRATLPGDILNAIAAAVSKEPAALLEQKSSLAV